MSVSRIASRYAKSLVGLAIEQNQLEEVYNDMQYFIAISKASYEFEVMLKSPVIPGYRKLKVIDAVIKGKFNTITNAFIKILVKKGREPFLIDIARSVIVQYNSYKNITPVKLKSAVSLNKTTIDKILSKLKAGNKITNIDLTTEIDESIIGGFILQYEDKLYDASISRNLNQLKKDFTENKYVKELFK